MQLLFTAILGKLIALSVGFYFLRYLPRPYKGILLQVIIAAFCEILGYYIGHILLEQNVWLFNCYWIIAELLILGLAGQSLFLEKQMKFASVLLIIISLVIWIIHLFKDGIFDFSPIAVLVTHISLVIIYIALMLRQALFNNQKLSRQPIFWLCLSMLLYFGGAIPLYGLFNYLNDNSPKLLNKLFDITLILNFIRYPLVAISFYLLGKQNKALNTAKNSY